MTEDEAKTKWCPFVRIGANVGSEVASSFNRYLAPDFPDSPLVMCLGSKCMMWHWHETPEFKAVAEDQLRKYGARLVTEHGFCGLAGRGK